ncbi:uncharacterized protein [Amphiura filiformis]|uniref:uncharacterized protein n=1 Tax=Amphiura filiformis TaxID=82378 RepID=UPI003B219063
MAEASTLGSTISKHFLKCIICSDAFSDPRALPCLHPFCCECLEHWAKSCSNDNSIVSCPLCKKTYRIPEEEGIKGFPVHFLVTNLKDTVGKAKQKTASTNHCENHKGKELEYFCENCGCAACSDCGILDPAHKDHSFIQLKEASKQQSSSLDNLTRRVGIVKEKYTTAIQETQQVKQNLDRNINAKIQAIDEARNEHMQQVDNLVRAYKQNVYNKREENTRAIEQIEEKLQVDLATLRSSTELASNVIESGSDSDIISLYPSLSSSLQQICESQPTPVGWDSSNLGQIKLEPPQPTSVDLPSLEQLICSKLHITNTSSQCIQVSHQTRKLLMKPVDAANFIPPETANHFSRQDHLKSTDMPETSQGPNFRLFSKFRSTTSTKHSTQPSAGKKWKECGQIKTTPECKFPTGIVIHHNGDIVLTSRIAPVTVFSKNGNFKHVIKGSPSNIADIAISPSNQYIIPGEYGKNEFYIYDSEGVLVSTTSTYDVIYQTSSPKTVAVDSTGRIIVGLGCDDHKSMSIHQPDGTLILEHETKSSPRFLTCTPDDNLIIAFDDDTLQVMDQLGYNARIIKPPPGIKSWQPQNVCCSKQGELFVGNGGFPKAVYRYVYKGGKYKYLDCITTMDYTPDGIALSADDQELFVVDYCLHLVKIFK